jgi:hypothetical protein
VKEGNQAARVLVLSMAAGAYIYILIQVGMVVLSFITKKGDVIAWHVLNVSQD